MKNLPSKSFLIAALGLLLASSTSVYGQSDDSTQTFEEPQFHKFHPRGYYRIATCFSNGNKCGDLVADRYCRNQRAGRVLSFKESETTTKKSIFLNNKKVCVKGCKVFEEIICTKD